jgi:uncharacterized membrane protein
LIERVESADRLILYANLGFLFCLSLLPFFTAYVIEKKIAAFAVALYAISMIVTGFSFLLLRIAIHRVLRRLGSLRPEDTAERGKHLTSLALYLLAVPLAYFHAGLSLILIAVVTIIWIVPSLAISRKAAKR